MTDLPREFQVLLTLARSGDQAAMGQLVEGYRSYLLLVANGDIDERIVSKAAPSDVVQTSLMHAQQAFPNFGGNSEEEFRAWMRAILKNDLLKTRRGLLTQKRDARREVRLQESGRHWSLVDPQLTPSTEALSSERMGLIAAAFEELSPDHQQVIRLRNFAGLSFADIGNQMNRSSDATSKLWARAIDSLRKRLENLAPELFAEVNSEKRSLVQDD